MIIPHRTVDKCHLGVCWSIQFEDGIVHLPQGLEDSWLTAAGGVGKDRNLCGGIVSVTEPEGNVYYGEWKEFSITETPGNYGPIAYLYKNVELTPTTATVRPLVLQGNSAIRVQQLDVSPQQGGDMYSVNFSGQCAPLKLTGLKPSSRYVVIIKIVTEDPIPDNPSSHTVYSGRIGFTTPSYSEDINGDGEVNIADVNSLIDIILGGLDYSDGLSDVNKDGEVNIADINAIINIILSGT